MIYLDNNATTPLDPRVLDAMLPYFKESFGNASSRHHALGCDAAKAVETARDKVAALIGADPREIVFTSGATEADNLAIKGVPEKGRHLVTCVTEHRAVLDAAEHLERAGWTVTWLRVSKEGMIDLDALRAALTEKTALVSLMHANNETGVLHPIREIGAICRAKGVLFHTDATQSFGKEPIDVNADHVDLLSLSAHKIHGPKGVGALYVRRKEPRVRLEAQIHGGGHEKGLRSGTLNVPAIVGLGRAAELCRGESWEGVRALRDRLQKALPGTLNGHPTKRVATTLNLCFEGVDGEALMKALPDVAVSSSSACTSAQMQPSYVLGAMGADDKRIRGSVRFSLGRFTTEAEIDAAAGKIRARLAQRP